MTLSFNRALDMNTLETFLRKVTLSVSVLMSSSMSALSSNLCTSQSRQSATSSKLGLRKFSTEMMRG